MRILSLAVKDLLQIGRDRKSALFLLLMPLLFTWIFGLVFSTDAGSDPRLPVGLLNLDPQGLLSESFAALLEQSDTVRPVLLQEDQLGDSAVLELQKRVRTEALAAAVIIPAGFSAQTMAGDAPLLTVIVDKNLPVGQAADQSVQWAATRLLGAVEIAQLSLNAREQYQRFSGEAERQAYLSSAIERTIAAWEAPRLTVEFEQAGSAPAGVPEGYAQSSAGMLVLFAIFGLVLSGYVLLGERRAGALQRMLTTTMSRIEIIAGHTLAMFVVAWVQILLLTAAGQLFFGVDYWGDLLALLLMSAALALWVSSLGLFISAISRQENQVVLYALGSMLILGLMGGAIFPLDITGKTFAAIGHLLPSAWAIDGFQNIILRSAGVGSILLPAGILLAYALLFFSLAAWRFRFE